MHSLRRRHGERGERDLKIKKRSLQASVRTFIDFPISLTPLSPIYIYIYIYETTSLTFITSVFLPTVTREGEEIMGKKGLQRSIKICLSKLKKPALHLPNTPNATAAIASRLLSACKYPKTPSFSRDGNEHAATLSDVDRFLYENFHSLYFRDSETSSESPRFADPPSDVRSSHRFFASPGTSNSLVEEIRMRAASPSSSSLSTRTSEDEAAVPGGGVAVMTFTKDPYMDFRRSMQEMVEGWHKDPKQPLDWDFMEELLFCYLELNDRSVHRYILKAFTDLASGFRSRSPPRMRQVPAAKCRRRRRAREGDPA